jgi:alkylhydroperoxidase family enzyme
VHKYPSSSKKFLPVEIEDFATQRPIKLAKLREELIERKKRLDALSETKLFLANEKLLQRDHEIRVDYAKKEIEKVEKSPIYMKASRLRGIEEDLTKMTLKQLEESAVKYKKECAKHKRAMQTVETMDWVSTHRGNLARSNAMLVLINREIAKRRRSGANGVK